MNHDIIVRTTFAVWSFITHEETVAVAKETAYTLGFLVLALATSAGTGYMYVQYMQ